MVKNLRKQIVPIAMKEEIVVNRIVIEDRALVLKKKIMKSYPKVLLLIKEFLRGAANEERRELYGIGLTKEKRKVEIEETNAKQIYLDKDQKLVEVNHKVKDPMKEKHIDFSRLNERRTFNQNSELIGELTSTEWLARKNWWSFVSCWTWWEQ